MLARTAAGGGQPRRNRPSIHLMIRGVLFDSRRHICIFDDGVAVGSG
jgi:hypothetical protein